LRLSENLRYWKILRMEWGACEGADARLAKPGTVAASENGCRTVNTSSFALFAPIRTSCHIFRVQQSPAIADVGSQIPPRLPEQK